VNSLLFVVDAIDSDVFDIRNYKKFFIFLGGSVASTFFEKTVRLLLMSVLSLSFIFLNENGRGYHFLIRYYYNILGFFGEILDEKAGKLCRPRYI